MRVINILEVQGEIDVLRRIKKILFTGNKVNFESIVSSMNNTESDWNTWAIRNWGTKKNATDGYCEFDEVESGTFARIVFTTEDTTPDKVIERLSTFFPKNKFCLSWASQKGESVGEICYKNGEVTSKLTPSPNTTMARVIHQFNWGLESLL